MNLFDSNHHRPGPTSTNDQIHADKSASYSHVTEEIIQSELRPTRNATRYGLLTLQEWRFGLILTSILSFFSTQYTIPYNITLTASFSVFYLIAFHFTVTLGRIIPIPHIALISLFISHLLAPLISVSDPPTNPAYSIPTPDEYFNFASKAFLCSTIGWVAPYFVCTYKRFQPRRVSTEDLFPYGRSLWILYFIGVVSAIIRILFTLPPSVSFFIILISHLRFVSCGAWIASGDRGKVFPILILLALELYQSISSSIFNELILWSGTMLCVWVGSRPRSRILTVTLLLAGLFFLYPLQRAKTALRKQNTTLVGSTSQSDSESVLSYQFDRFQRLASQIPEEFSGIFESRDGSKTLGDEVLRFNQGWMVNRVLHHIPAYAPFANGETLKTAFVSSIAPRFLMENKFQSGGREILKRFTGISLSDNTSMNIGYAAEMYANFGLPIAYIAIAGFTLMMSLILLGATLLVRNRFQLIGFVPYLGYRMTVTEWNDVTDAMNYFVKSLMVIVLVRFLLPSLFAAPAVEYSSGESFDEQD